MSQDTNHEDIRLYLVRAQASVVDTSKIGGGVPDLHVGFAGTERWVETKRPKEPKGQSRPGSRCGDCGKTYPMHQKKPERTCGSFRRIYVKSKAAGVVSNRQKKWHREWRGRPVRVVLNYADADRLLDEMAREGRLLREAGLV